MLVIFMIEIYLFILGRILTVAAMMTVADGVIRMRASDFPSFFCIHLTGTAPPTPRYFLQPFGIDISAFKSQSEDFIFHTPDQIATRTRILDYFIAQRDLVKDDHLIFQFEADLQVGNASKLFEQICFEIGYPTENIPLYFTGEQTEFVYNYPELRYYRDITFLFKYLVTPDAAALPEIKKWHQKVISTKYNVIN